MSVEASWVSMVNKRKGSSRQTSLISPSNDSFISSSSGKPLSSHRFSLPKKSLGSGLIYRRQSSIHGRKFLGESGERRRGSQMLEEVDEEELERRRRRIEHLQFRLRFFITLVTTANKLCNKHFLSCERLGPAYTNQHKQVEIPGGNKSTFRGPYFDKDEYKANKQMRLSTEARRILTKRPEQRSHKEIEYAIIALRGIQQIADYPVRMQYKIATYSLLESYTPGRIVVRENDPAHCFYFILYGTVLVAVLKSSGDQAETVVELKRGDSFGELAIMRKSKRQSTVITKTDADLLSISAESYESIFMVGGQKTIHDPDHNQFMESLDFLNGWPIELLQKQHDKFVFCFFKRGTVMVKNSNKSKWIYILKSGSAQVMLVLEKVYPQVSKRRGCLVNYTRHIDHPTDAFYDSAGIYNPGSIPQSDLPYPRSSRTNVSDDEDDIDDIVKRVMGPQRPLTATYDVLTSNTHGKWVTGQTIRSNTAKQNVKYSFEKQGRSKTTMALVAEQQLVEKNKANLQTSKIKHGKKTFMDDIDVGDVEMPDGKPQFVAVQTLQKGDVFGLQDLFKTDQPGMCILSNGAECLMLDKTFFLEHSPKSLINRLRNQVTYYPTTEELQIQLQERINWETFKKITVTNARKKQQVKKLLAKELNICGNKLATDPIDSNQPWTF